MNSSRISQLVLILSLVGSYAGCASSGTGSSPDPTPTPVPAPPPAPPIPPTPKTAPTINQLENAKTAAQGVTAKWELAEYATNHEIEGYASATSVPRGGSIKFFVNNVDSSYTLEIYRLGWYGGQGGRLMQAPVTLSRITQPVCPIVDPASSLLECNWNVSYTLNIPNNANDPTDWASGYYVVKLIGTNGKQSYIPFIVRDDARNADIMMQASVTTYQAYNNWGQEPVTATNPYPGKSLYVFNSIGGKPATKVSFNRPHADSFNGFGAGQVFAFEVRMLRFLEKEGYDVVYSTNFDTHVAGNSLARYKAFLSVGHDEYWTKQMRDAIESARDQRVNLGFFGGNMGYWQMRFEPAVATGETNKTMVSYKEAADPAASSAAETTTQFRLAPVSRPEASLIGVMYDFSPVYSDMVISNCVPWVCAGTNLVNGDKLIGMLGYEVDRISSSSPANIQPITASPYNVIRNGVTETRYSNMTYYQAASGSGVFATGSMYWNYGLNAYGNVNPDYVNPNVQQITRNVLNAFVPAPLKP